MNILLYVLPPCASLPQAHPLLSVQHIHTNMFLASPLLYYPVIYFLSHTVPVIYPFSYRCTSTNLFSHTYAFFFNTNQNKPVLQYQSINNCHLSMLNAHMKYDFPVFNFYQHQTPSFEYIMSSDLLRSGFSIPSAITAINHVDVTAVSITYNC